MPGSTDVIREFLVSLGWKIDEKGQKNFTDAVATTTLKVAALGTAIAATATAVVAGVAKIADQMEALYFASQRTNASVANIQALGFAASQMGSSAAAAQASLENLARFMRNSPGAEGLLRGIGVQTRDMNGGLRDTTAILGDLGKQFANMPYYRANAYAQALGIDERTLMAMRQGLGNFNDEYRDMLRAAGLDSQEAAKQSHLFMNEVRTLGSAFVILGQKIASSLAGSLSGDLRRFREGVVANFGHITEIVGSVVKGILFLADVISTLSFRAMQVIGGLVDWFESWDDGAKKAAAALGMLLVAWKVLNSGILATPLGIVLALGSAILALYDDYKVWKAGGKSLIDWGKWEPDIKAALANLKELGGVLGRLAHVLLNIFGPALSAIGDILAGAIKTGFGNLLDMVTLITDVLTGKWQDAGKKAQEIMSRTASFAKNAFASALNGVRATVDNAEKSMNGGDTTPPPSPAPEANSSPATPASGNPRDPRGIRNNNPGNINYVGQTGATRESGPNGRFAVFQTAEQGLSALANQLRLYARRGINTVRDIIAKWAPPGENNTQAYIARVSKSLGVSATQSIDVNDPRIMQGLMNAIIRVENGKNPYSAEQLAAASGVPAAGAAGRAVVIHQQNSTVVHGAGDPKATGQAVANAQDGVNQRLIRNMRSPAT